MAGAYVYTPAIWPPLAAALIVAAMGLYSWRRRDVPAARPLAAVMACGTLWLLGIACEAAAVAPDTKIAWFRFQGVWRMPVVTADLCFFLEYAYPGRWLTRRNLILLSIPVLLDILLVIVNDGHLTWRRLEIGPDGSVLAELAPAGLIMTAYGVGLVLANSAALLWLFIHSPQHRWPVALMLGGQLAARVLYIVDAAHWPSPVAVDPVTTGILLSAAAYATALFGFRILDPVPAARAAVLEQMRDGMVVFDGQWRVASLNRAAANILGASVASARGQVAADLLAAFSDLSGRLAGTEPAESFEVCLGSGASARSYQAGFSALYDFRGLLLGHLLLLRDVTEQKRAQAQILEQQRSLAMLRERGQLARELHDGLGQVLGFASLKMGATRKLIADGKLAKADDMLAHLEEAVGEAHADLREMILNLRTAPSGEKPFLASLQRFVDGYRQNYGMRVDLEIGEGVNESLFTSSAQMQLFRILQEAFSNARKHAQTDCVRASFELQGDLLCMGIQDDGIGFDPSREAAETRGSHLGLRFMAERAEALGGSVRVASAPGAGTCVEVTVPVREDAGTPGTATSPSKDLGERRGA